MMKENIDFKENINISSNEVQKIHSKNIPKMLKCYICENIAENVVQIKCCQEIFCEEHIKEEIMKNFTCPNCKEDATLNKLADNLILRDQIDLINTILKDPSYLEVLKKSCIKIEKTKEDTEIEPKSSEKKLDEDAIEPLDSNKTVKVERENCQDINRFLEDENSNMNLLESDSTVKGAIGDKNHMLNTPELSMMKNDPSFFFQQGLPSANMRQYPGMLSQMMAYPYSMPGFPGMPGMVNPYPQPVEEKKNKRRSKSRRSESGSKSRSSHSNKRPKKSRKHRSRNRSDSQDSSRRRRSSKKDRKHRSKY